MRDAQFDVFLSHSSQDDAAAIRIATRLREAGLAPWIDNWNCSSGGRFLHEIDQGIKDSRAFAVLIGPSGITPWMSDEIDVAYSRSVKDRSFRIFLVFLPGLPDPFDRTTLLAFLNTKGWVDFRKGFETEHQFQSIVNAIQGRSPGPLSIDLSNSREPPYRGLEVFDEAHAEFYFGRDADVQHLLEKLKGSRFLAVIGPSGTGKSSLVRAGLIPALRGGQLPASEHWRIVVTRPGAHPLASLAAELVRLDPATPMGPTLDRLSDDARTLDHAASLLFDQSNPRGRLLLVVDQFEELFTLCHDDEERQRYIDNLLYAATTPDGRCLVVITLRADFYPRCSAYPELAALVGGQQVLIGPLDREGLRAVIVEPAYKAGLQFEDGLVELILEDVERQPGALPLLEHALLELFNERRGALLTLEGYQASGGVSGAIAKTAESQFAALTPDEQVVARRMFLRLTEPGEGTEDTRRRARLDELALSPDDAVRVETVVDRLVEARLITTSVASDAHGQPQVDVAHEALIRGWPRLKSWLDEDRAGLRVQRRITNDALEWQRRDYDEDTLYRGARLLEANEFAQRPGSQLNELELAFIAWGNAIQDRERAEFELQRTRRENSQRRWIAILLSAFILAFLPVVWARDERDNAQVAERTAVAEKATSEVNAQAFATSAASEATARAEADVQKDIAEANAHEADEAKVLAQGAEGSAQAEAERAQTAVADTLAQKATAEAERQNAVAQQEIAEANATLAANEQANALAQKATAEAEQANAVAQQARAEANAQESKARELAAVASSGTVRIDQALLAAVEASNLDSAAVPEYLVQQILLNEPRFLKVLNPPNPNRELDFDFCLLPSDGDFLVATLTSLETVMLWNYRTSEIVAVLGKDEGFSGKQGLIACDPTGALIATTSSFRSGVTVWDVGAAQVKYRIPEAGLGELRDVSFSPSGNELVINTETRVFFWDVQGQREVAPKDIPTGTSMLSGQFVRYSESGSSVAIGGYADGKLTIVDFEGDRSVVIQAWDPATESMQSPMHMALANSGAFLVVVTVSVAPFDAGWTWKAKLIRPFDGGRIDELAVRAIVTDASGDFINDVAVSPDDRLVALASTSGVIYLFGDAGTGAFQRLEELGSVIQGYAMLKVAFVPDDPSTLVSRTGDGATVLWDLDGSAASGVDVPVDGRDYPSVDISADGSVVAVVGCRGDLSVWNVRNQKLMFQEPIPRSVCWEGGGIARVAISSERQLVAVWRSDGQIALFDLTTLRFLKGAAAEIDVMGALRFSSDGRWLYGAAGNGVLYRWQIGGQGLSGEERFAIATKPVMTYAWSANGRYLVVELIEEMRGQMVSMVSLTLWDMNDLSKPRKLPADFADLHWGFAVGVTDDATVIAARSDGMMIKWTRDASGSWSQTFGGFYPYFLNQWIDMQMLDETTYVGISAFGNRVTVFKGGEMPVLSWQVPLGTGGGSVGGTTLAVSENGNVIVTGHRDGVIVWDLDSQNSREIACSGAGRNFTMDEWRQFFGDEPYRRTCEQFPLGWEVPLVQRDTLLPWL